MDNDKKEVQTIQPVTVAVGCYKIFYDEVDCSFYSNNYHFFMFNDMYTTSLVMKMQHKGY